MPPLNADTGEAWATRQVQAGFAVLLPIINRDWADEHAAQLLRMAKGRFDDAMGHRRAAKLYRSWGQIGTSHHYFREAQRALRMARYYAEKVTL